ncbi:MAG: hypothetical protein IRZ16_20735 [Myxococcaceae bacterium]|nr:hypothetical protein [Myxococcaceae bacterium]
MQARTLARPTFAAVIAGLTATVTLIVASCGPTEPIHCGPGTCSGCCTGEDKCIALDKQSFGVCGADGERCGACLPGQMCAHGACVADPDAGTGGDLCTPRTCPNGCCLGDACLMPVDQGDGFCGTGGAQCSACPSGSVCRDGACAPPMDAGSCGQRGAPCCANGGCFLGLTCQKGICDFSGGQDGGTTDAGTDAGTPKDGGSGGTQPIGAACVANSQCQSGLCRVLGFSGGYCTQSCQSSADCPAGSVCGADPSDATGATKMCFSSCAQAGTSGGCRTDYVCERRGMTGSVPGCRPACVSPTTCGAASTCDSRGFCCGADGFACCEGSSCDNGLVCDGSGYCKPSAPDAGPGTGGIGAACSGNQDCTSNVCVQEIPGGSPGCTTGPCWPGGYCIQDCTSTACPAGSSCSPANYLSSNAICVQNCPQAGGQSTCRSGYVCDLNWVTTPGQGVCVYACHSDSDCNSATLKCFGGFCCGKQTYHCCANDTCPFGGTCGSDGYCH